MTALQKIRWASEMGRRISRSRVARANRLARAAGVGEARNVWHNALLAFKDGRPWREVDYSLLRAAIREDTRSLEPSAIEDRLYRRLCAEGAFFRD